MFVKEKLIALVALMVLTGCAVTQPKSPLYNGYKSNQAKQAKKQISQPQYKIVEKTVVEEHKVYHKVKSGDYVWALGRKYKVSPYKIIKQNKLNKRGTLTKGQNLFIKIEKRKKIVKTKVKINAKQYSSIQKNKDYSLTRNRKLYNQNTAEFRKVKSIPRQDPRKVNKDKNLDFGYHKVRRGENLFRIGRKYGVSVFDLMAYNDLKSPKGLKAGQELKIPVAKKDSVVEEHSIVATSATLKFDKVDRNLAKKKGFIYPVNGKIVSKFGKQGHGIRNDGVDIAVALGTPIRATQSGTVRYAEDVATLGNMILIKHRSGYISAYTHNSKLLVKKGARVVKGQVIALSGDTGNAKQPMLHFELRRYGKAINPTRVLN